MLRIGLLGVPGSGKSALAATLKTAFEMENLDCEECGATPVVVIDDYIEETAHECDLAMGFSASYLANLYAALGRERRERVAAGGSAATIITCGTLLETSAYMTLYGLSQLSLDKDDAEKQDTLRRIEAGMRILACMYMDTFKYDYVFYLPPLPIPTKHDDDRYVLLDRNLQVAFQAFDLVKTYPLMVEGGSMLDLTAKRCEEALNVIKGVDDS